MFFCPQDPPARRDPGGYAAHVFASVASLGSIAAVLLVAFWFKSNPAMRVYWIYSLVSSLVILVSGGLTAAAMAGASPIFGLLERITIGTFELWLVIVSLRLLRLEPSEAAPSPQVQSV